MGSHKVTRSEEHKKRIAEALKKHWSDPDVRKEASEKQSGELSPNFGRRASPETRALLSELRKGEANAFYGKTHSEETREAIRAYRVGHPASALAKYGVTPDEYTQAMADGKRWCFVHKGFVPQDRISDKIRRKAKSGACDACFPEWNRKQSLKHKFGIEPAWYDATLAKQNGVCAICGVADIAQNRKYMCIDHNHKTGALRGILCSRCNTSVERIETVPNWSLLAADYLLKYSGEGA